MSLVENLCKEIGVEVNEKWLGNDYFTYIIRSNGQLVCVTDGDMVTNDIVRVLMGELKPLWQPKVGERYFIPYLNNTSEETLWITDTWGRDVYYDSTMYQRRLVYKTKEEATKNAKKMLESIK